MKGIYLVGMMRRRRIVLWCVVYRQGASRPCLTVSVSTNQTPLGLKTRAKTLLLSWCASLSLCELLQGLNKIFIDSFHQIGQDTEPSVRVTSELLYWLCGEYCVNCSESNVADTNRVMSILSKGGKNDGIYQCGKPIFISPHHQNKKCCIPFLLIIKGLFTETCFTLCVRRNLISGMN